MKTKYKIGDEVKIINKQDRNNGRTGIISEIDKESAFDLPLFVFFNDETENDWYNETELELSQLKKTIRDVEIGDEVIDDLEGEQIIMDVGINGFITESCYYCTFDKAEKDGWEVKEEEETKYDPCSECLYKSEYLKARI